MFDQDRASQNAFLRNIRAIRDTTRVDMARDAAGPSVSIRLLQSVLSAEIVCVLRYTMISVSQDGLKNERIGAEFQEQANDERRHMMMAAARIEQLGGVPDFSPGPHAATVAALASGADFASRVRENLEAEQCVIEHYHELISFLGPRDAETCQVLQDIVRDEEDHTNDMEDLLRSYPN